VPSVSGESQRRPNVFPAVSPIVAREGVANETAIGRQPDGEASVASAMTWPGTKNLSPGDHTAKGARDRGGRSHCPFPSISETKGAGKYCS